MRHGFNKPRTCHRTAALCRSERAGTATGLAGAIGTSREANGGGDPRRMLVFYPLKRTKLHKRIEFVHLCALACACERLRAAKRKNLRDCTNRTELHTGIAARIRVPVRCPAFRPSSLFCVIWSYLVLFGAIWS